MWTNHHWFENILILHTISQKVLNGINLEFVNEDSLQYTALFLAYLWILDNLPNLIVEYLLFLFLEFLDAFTKRSRLDYLQFDLPELVLSRLIAIKLFQPNEYFLDQRKSKVRVFF